MTLERIVKSAQKSLYYNFMEISLKHNWRKSALIVEYACTNLKGSDSWEVMGIVMA